MANPTQIPGDLILVNGAILNPNDIQYPAGSIENADVSPSAALDASKLQSFIPLRGEVAGTIASGATRRRLRWVKGAAGSLHSVFTVSVQTPPSGSSTATVDLQVGGVSVLAAVVTINSSTSANTELTATVSDPTVADGERIDVVVTGTPSGTDAMPANIDFQVDLDETYQA